MKDRKILTYELESWAHESGYAAVCGVDEAGRGPLAGSVYAAAVILPDGLVIDGLDDSKKLSEKKREALFGVITDSAVSYCIASASEAEIDELNILNATLLAMRRAIDGLDVRADFALIDGNCTRDFTLPCRSVIGGDGISPSIAAASILAKVSRDRDCKRLDELYPEYGFAKHKGYGTAQHMQVLRELGPCAAHRRTFLKFLDK